MYRVKKQIFRESKELFDERYQIFWLSKEVVEKPPPESSSPWCWVEDLLSFKEFVPVAWALFFTQLQLRLVFKVSLPSLLGYEEQQLYQIAYTKSNALRMRCRLIFRCGFFISSSLCKTRFVSLLKNSFLLRKPIFFCFDTSKD